MENEVLNNQEIERFMDFMNTYNYNLNKVAVMHTVVGISELCIASVLVYKFAVEPAAEGVKFWWRKRKKSESGNDEVEYEVF